MAAAVRAAASAAWPRRTDPLLRETLGTMPGLRTVEWVQRRGMAATTTRTKPAARATRAGSLGRWRARAVTWRYGRATAWVLAVVVVVAPHRHFRKGCPKL
jgi:hypothetical protein